MIDVAWLRGLLPPGHPCLPPLGPVRARCAISAARPGVAPLRSIRRSARRAFRWTARCGPVPRLPASQSGVRRDGRAGVVLPACCLLGWVCVAMGGLAWRGFAGALLARPGRRSGGQASAARFCWSAACPARRASGWVSRRGSASRACCRPARQTGVHGSAGMPPLGSASVLLPPLPLGPVWSPPRGWPWLTPFRAASRKSDNTAGVPLRCGEPG